MMYIRSDACALNITLIKVTGSEPFLSIAAGGIGAVVVVLIAVTNRDCVCGKEML